MAVLGNNPLYAEINKYYIIHVYEYKGSETITVNGKKKTINHYHPQNIVSANTLSRYLEDEETKISLFNDVLATMRDIHPRLIRQRLKIEFRKK